MTDSSALAASPTLVSNGNWFERIALVALLTALADWLFFRQHVGVSLVLFIVALATAVLAANHTREQMPASPPPTSSFWLRRCCQSLEDTNVI